MVVEVAKEEEDEDDNDDGAVVLHIALYARSAIKHPHLRRTINL